MLAVFTSDLASDVFVFFCRTRLFPESAVRNIMFQILQGLAFIHKHGMSAAGSDDHDQNTTHFHSCTCQDIILLCLC